MCFRWIRRQAGERAPTALDAASTQLARLPCRPSCRAVGTADHENQNRAEITAGSAPRSTAIAVMTAGRRGVDRSTHTTNPTRTKRARITTTPAVSGSCMNRRSLGPRAVRTGGVTWIDPSSPHRQECPSPEVPLWSEVRGRGKNRPYHPRSAGRPGDQGGRLRRLLSRRLRSSRILPFSLCETVSARSDLGVHGNERKRKACVADVDHG